MEDPEKDSEPPSSQDHSVPTEPDAELPLPAEETGATVLSHGGLVGRNDDEDPWILLDSAEGPAENGSEAKTDD